MLETNNPLIDVDELMRRIKEEVQNHGSSSFHEASPDRPSLSFRSNSWHVEALISNAEAKSRVRTQLPSQLNCFPFNRSKALQQFVMKIFELLFRDQRSVNYSFIQAIKELGKDNQKLSERTTVIQAQLTEAQNLIELMHKQIETMRVEKDKVQEQFESEDKR